MNDIYKNRFVRLVLESLRPSLEKVRDIEWEQDPEGEKYFRPKTPPKLNSEQAYHWSVFHYMSNLLGIANRLEEIEIFIGKFPSPRTFEKKGISEDKWIKYHYSNYNEAMVTIYDTALVLTNEVFILGLNPRVCNKQTVADNSRINQNPVGKILRELNAITIKYRYDRNLSLHRGQEPVLGILQFLEALSLQQLSDEPIMSIHKLDKLYKLARNAICEDLSGRTKTIIDIIHSFFDSLFDQYEFQTKQMNKFL